jgi:hypothetical protein
VGKELKGMSSRVRRTTFYMGLEGGGGGCVFKGYGLTGEEAPTIILHSQLQYSM